MQPFMHRAFALARKAVGNTSPNPPVGAVLVKDGAVVGEGYTQPAGGHHAEIMALEQAGERARGATLYVTLEPCSHYGRTPPCTTAIVRAGVTAVYLATPDPNPLVAGRGKSTLEAAGVATSLEDDDRQMARGLYEAHAKYSATGLPFVAAKFAMSLDGKLATRTGHSQWVTGPRARRCSNHLRGVYDAIMVGIETVLGDDPRLTWRTQGGRSRRRQPLRIVVDSRGRMPAGARMLKEPGRTLAATARTSEAWRCRLERVGATVVECSGPDGRVDLRALLGVLGEQEVTSVIVEGGATLLGSLFDQRLVDKVLAFIAPVVIGGAGAPSPVGGQGAATMKESLRLRDVTTRRLGEDRLMVGYPGEEA